MNNSTLNRTKWSSNGLLLLTFCFSDLVTYTKASYSVLVRPPVIQPSRSLTHQARTFFADLSGAWGLAWLNYWAAAVHIPLWQAIARLGDPTPTQRGKLHELTSHTWSCQVWCERSLRDRNLLNMLCLFPCYSLWRFKRTAHIISLTDVVFLISFDKPTKQPTYRCTWINDILG